MIRVQSLEKCLWKEIETSEEGLLLSWCWCLWVERQVFKNLGPRYLRSGCQTVGIFKGDAIKWKLEKLLTGFNSVTGRKCLCRVKKRCWVTLPGILLPPTFWFTFSTPVWHSLSGSQAVKEGSGLQSPNPSTVGQSRLGLELWDNSSVTAY